MRHRYTLTPRRRAWVLIAVASLAAVTAVWLFDWGDDIRRMTGMVSTTEGSPESRLTADELTTGGDFVFAIGQGSGLHGYEVLKVWADGSARYTYRDLDRPNRFAWRRVDFQIDAPTIAALRRLLANVDYGGLKRSYHLKGVSDGTQWVLNVRAAGRSKTVFCSNHFPTEVTRLADFVHERIIEPRRAQFGAAAGVAVTPTWQEHTSDFDSADER